MSVKAVIDTNVLVSAFLSKNQDSPTVRIANAIFDERFIPVYSPDMIAEYTEVLGRDYLKLQTARVYALIRQIQASGEEAHPADSDEPFPDPDDKVQTSHSLILTTRCSTAPRLRGTQNLSQAT